MVAMNIRAVWKAADADIIKHNYKKDKATQNLVLVNKTHCFKRIPVLDHWLVLEQLGISGNPKKWMMEENKKMLEEADDPTKFCECAV